MHPDTTTRKEVPSDFPREEVLGAVSGTQPKLLLRMNDDGTYGPVRPSDAELQARFEVAEDIVGQLHAYFLRKQSENPDWTDEHNLERIGRGLASKVSEGKWPFSEAEQSWIMDRLRGLSGNLS